MGSLSTGGGSSAIAASAHASCARHRHTDPLVTGMSRSKLADRLGHPDTTAGIPEARWMRAMTFERLVRDKRFVSQLMTTAVGALGLDRPLEIRRTDCHVDPATTAAALEAAHGATASGAVTILTGLAVPFVGMEGAAGATPVKPDFAIVAPRPAPDDGGTDGSWLILGDAKDYERVRTRIDDQRLLKGFLQVALGAESAAAWSLVPAGMQIHRWGALAVPRNAFLQPEAVVECLDDHRQEVRNRADERLELRAALGGRTIDEAKLADYVDGELATFDPRSCVTCSLFDFCRAELRKLDAPEALLTEIGIRPEHRPMLGIYLETGEEASGIPASVVANVTATDTGLPQWTGQRRIDPVGQPGTVEVVLAKADAAALGIHGLAVRRVLADRTHTEWTTDIFIDPQSPRTRTAVMRLLGKALGAAMTEQERNSPGNPGPVHVITPDSVTADVLVSIADSVAGVETSRLRWQRDLDLGRPALTFDGEPANVPPALPALARLAVSFLLEADRARAMHLRTPLVDLRAVLANHVVPGGPAGDAGRLDYLVTWAEARRPLDHRVVSDSITDSPHTPGARLSNIHSDAIHVAQLGRHSKKGRGTPDPKRYDALIRQELDYKEDVVGRAVRVLDGLPDSKLRSAHRALEHRAQEVWRHRLTLRANDLVRFGRTSEFWRDRHVDMLDADAKCDEQLSALGNPQAALDLAIAAGTRDVARATVLSVDPLRLDIESRRITDGSTIVALVIDGSPCVDDDNAALTIQKGSFKFAGFSIGELAADRQTKQGAGLLWKPVLEPVVQIGSNLIVADADWFKTFVNRREIAVERPSPDTTSAPKPSCDEHSFTADPANHQWCCRPHEQAEADTADWIADRRARGEMNPDTWPPIVDADEFDISPKGAATAAQAMGSVGDQPPADLTMDDID